jgi:hypothetical protein
LISRWQQAFGKKVVVAWFRSARVTPGLILSITTFLGVQHFAVDLLLSFAEVAPLGNNV